MPRFYKSALIVGIFIACLGPVQAESLYRIEAVELIGTALFDQELLENGLVTVKPTVSEDSSGDLRVLEQCLWSVGIDLSQQPVILTPGNMVCIGPRQEVLETIPSGKINSKIGCSDDPCTSYAVAGGTTFTLQLDAPLSFDLQPRNER
jgi:hypothetical protein